MLFLFISICSLTCLSNAVPLSKRLVDMTYVFDETTLNYPGLREFKMVDLLNGSEALDGIWQHLEEYTSAIHVGTHMDAPADVIKDGKTIDQIPISQFMAPAAVIDITAKAELEPDAEATVDDLLNWERTTGQNLNGTILLLRSGWGRKWNDRSAYFGTTSVDPSQLHFPGFAPEAAQWLVDNRDITGVGVDTLSIDRGSSTDFHTHLILLGHGLLALENVANMEELPIYGAKLFVFPMKIGKGSGAPARIIAIIPEILYSS